VAHLGRSFPLTAALLSAERAGSALCLSPAGIDRSYSLSPRRPSGFDLAQAGVSLAPPMPEADEPPPSSRDGLDLADAGTAVALVRLYGPVEQRSQERMCGSTEGYDTISERVCAAHEAPQVGAIVLIIDGPGGDAAGCEQACARMVRAAVASGKPVLAYIDEEAFSAHYWIASTVATGGIYLPPTGRVGSIGCMNVHVDAVAALAAEGLVYTFFSSPAGKVAGNFAEPLGDLARSRMTATVEDFASRFISAVAIARSMEVADVIALDGGILSGEAAVAAGLADAIATLEDVIALAAARASAGASAVATPVPAPQAPASEGSSMAHAFLSTPLLALLALPAEASSAAFEAALLPRLSALSAVMAATGDTDPVAVVGTVRALVTEAAEVPALRARVDALDLSAEHAERVAILEAAIDSGKLTAGAVWDTSDDGKKTIAAAFGPVNAAGTGSTLIALRAQVDRLSARPIGAKDEKANESSTATDVAVASLTDHERMTCAAKGWDPVAFAAHKQKTTGGAPAKSA
jgi:ClpP class serine protease